MIFLQALSDIESCFFFPNVQKKKKKKRGTGLSRLRRWTRLLLFSLFIGFLKDFLFGVNWHTKLKKKHNSRCNDIVVLGPKIDYFIPLRTAMGLDS